MKNICEMNEEELQAYKEQFIAKSIYNEKEAIVDFDRLVSLSKASGVYLSKAKDDEQMVFGWANVSIDKDGDIPIDWQGDITAPVVLEKAAYEYVLKYRQTGEMHLGEAKGELIESVMLTKEKMKAMGIPEGIVPEGWWIGFKINDKETFEKIKSGKYKMFSIQGKAKRLKV